MQKVYIHSYIYLYTQFYTFISSCYTSLVSAVPTEVKYNALDLFEIAEGG